MPPSRYVSSASTLSSSNSARKISLNGSSRSTSSQGAFRRSIPKRQTRNFCSAETKLQGSVATGGLQTEADQDHAVDTDIVAKIYMACILQGHRLGVAYFDVTTREMFVMEAWEDEEGEFPCLQMIKHQSEPDTIFTSTKMDHVFLFALQKKGDVISNSVREGSKEPSVKLVKSALFSHQQAKNRLAYLHIRGMDNDLNSAERLYVLNSMINLDSEMQVRAAGGLLAILQQELLIDTVTTSEDNGFDFHPIDRVQIEGISEISLDGFLHMDAAAYDALQIFQLEAHASAMGVGKAKEGFSVFGMLNKCVTLMGKRLLRLWFLRPMLEIASLNDRLDSIEALRSSTDMVEALQGCLKHVKDIPRILKKIISPSLGSTSHDWFCLVESIGALWQIRGILDIATSERRHNQSAFMRLKLVEKVFASVSEDLLHVSDLINGVIDFDQLCGENFDTMVAYGLCEELDKLKRLYEGLPDFLHQVTRSEQGKLPSELRCCGGTTVYIPQVGFFLRFTGPGTAFEVEKLGALSDFEFAFQGKSEEENRFPELFYRTSKTRELDEGLGDIYHKILDMEGAILRNLEIKVAEYSHSLSDASQVAAEIDCVIALTIAAREYNYVRPSLTEENILIIKNGRHVLQEMTVDQFVPNDTNFENEGRVCVVTGPNFSGKSIYAKQIALIVFLAHVGSFVPADEATVGLTDRIFTRIVSKETIAVEQSTFMIDLNQIAAMLRHSTGKSLCIIDEFGKGTLTEDGVGLLCATLEHFASQTCPPKVLAISHFTEVFDKDLLPKSCQVSFYTMSILEKKKAPNTGLIEDVVFLYKLKPGHAALSYGIHCAELAGLPANVIDRSKEILPLVVAGNPIKLYNSSSRVAKNRMCQDLVAKLLTFNSEEDDIEAFMKDISTITGIQA